MKKRTLSILLALCLVCSLLSVAAFAADGEIQGESLGYAVIEIDDVTYHIGEDNEPESGSLPDGVSYDYATNTLTLDDAELSQLYIDYAGTDDDGNAFQHLPNANLTIVLKGENTITNSNKEYNALDLENGVNVTIQGDGSLNLVGENESGGTLCIMYSTLCLKSGEVNVDSSSWYAVEAQGGSELTLTGGSLNVKTESASTRPMFLYSSTLTVTGGTHVIGNANKSNVDGIYASEGEISFEGGHVTLYGSDYAMGYETYEDSCGISVADGMVVTDAETGKELTVIGSYVSTWGSNKHHFGYTSDGSAELQYDPEAGEYLNSVTTLVISETGAETGTAGKADTVAGFSDVAGSAYYADAVEWAVENEITAGTSATTFSPNATVTRAQAVAFLWRAAGCPEPESTEAVYTDVTDSSTYYYKAVLWATEKGIVAGVGNNKFAPERTLAYDQILAMLCRATGGTSAGSSWSEDAIAWGEENGLTAGLNVTAKGDCPRCDVVYFLYLYNQSC